MNALPEIREYFLDSFGSYIRLDYGTGHELNFVVFLLCLFKLKVYKPDDFKALRKASSALSQMASSPTRLAGRKANLTATSVKPKSW